jgi:hypothetical protein
LGRGKARFGAREVLRAGEVEAWRRARVAGIAPIGDRAGREADFDRRFARRAGDEASEACAQALA